jgi:D-glycero-D-manno-heptose 1,7-bisphosphate phosphatase
MIPTSECPFRSPHSERSIKYVEKALQRRGGRKFLLLDRDGVVNHDPDNYVKNLSEFQLLDGVLEAIAKATRFGWIVNICTNQPGVGKELMSQADLNEIHMYLRRRAEDIGGNIGEIYYCPHQHGSGCVCRKPQPGLLYAIGKQFNMTQDEIRNAWFVGDHLRDICAGQAFGCNVALVETGHGHTFVESGNIPESVIVFRDLNELVDSLGVTQVE